MVLMSLESRSSFYLSIFSCVSMYICVKVLDLLELELKTVVSGHCMYWGLNLGSLEEK